MSTEEHPVKRIIVRRVTRADDLETHVSLLKVKGERLLDIRDYVPSLDQYGRGVTVDASLAEEIGEACRVVKGKP